MSAKVKCFLVVYDLSYWGGDYNGFGNTVPIPYETLKRIERAFRAVHANFTESDVVNAAFHIQTGHEFEHIVSYNMDETVDQFSQEWQECC